MRSTIFSIGLAAGLFSTTLSPRCEPYQMEVPRTILALYDSREEGTPDRTRIHRFAEMPLNHLGLMLRYHDIHGGYPAIGSLAGVRGVLTWFAGEAGFNDREYLNWAAQVVDSGRFFVILGHTGVHRASSPGHPDTMTDLNRFLAKIGIQLRGRWRSLTYNVEIAAQDNGMVGFERSFGGILAPFEETALSGEKARSHLSLRQRGVVGSESHLVVTHPAGGYAAPGYIFAAGPEPDFFQWYLNPFEFFRLAFRADGVPKPEVTTLSGRRILICQIDGDGWSNRSDIEKYRKSRTLAADVVRLEILEKFKDFHFTVAPIFSDLDPQVSDDPKARQAAASIFSLPHVDAGNHGYTHVLRWGQPASGEQAYSSDSRMPREAGNDSLETQQSWWNRLLRILAPARTATPGISRNSSSSINTATAGQAQTASQRQIDLNAELQLSTSRLNALLPGGKRVQSFHWSGDILPTESAVALLNESGLHNINGGPALFEHQILSCGWVSPLARPVGSLRQPLAGNANESSYSDQWENRYFGLDHWKKSMEFTEKPRRLRPLYLYAHMYAGERAACLQAALDSLAYARGQETAPASVSDYTRMVDGFFTARISQAGRNAWKIENRGGISTMRWDDRNTLEVDFARSVGVTGQRHMRESLYVSLDNQESAPVVALRPAKAAGSPANTVYLIHSRWPVWGLRRESAQFAFSARGFGAGEMFWQVSPSKRYAIHFQPELGAGQELEVTSDPAGVLAFSLPERTGQVFTVAIRELK